MQSQQDLVLCLKNGSSQRSQQKNLGHVFVPKVQDQRVQCAKASSMSNQRNVQRQATSAGSNPDGCADSTEILIYYYLEIFKYLSQ